VSITPIARFTFTHLSRILPTLANGRSRAALTELLISLASHARGGPTLWDTITKSTFERIVRAGAGALKVLPHDLRDNKPLGGSTAYPNVDSPYYRYGSQISGQKPSDYPERFLTLLRQTVALSFKNEAIGFITVALPELPHSNVDFWGNYKSILGFTKSLIEVVEQYKDRDIEAKAADFIRTVLSHIFTYWAGHRPVEPKTWKRAPPKNNCQCEPCRRLTDFLVSSTQENCRFTYAEHIRRHLQERVPNAADYVFDTEKTRSPYTLVVRKTKKGYQRLLKAWATDGLAIEQYFKSLQKPYLGVLLGPDYLNLLSVTGRRAVRQPAQAESPLQPVSAPTQNIRDVPPIIGVKRKAVDNIVDLTGDASD
jgi:hypothetical protein